MAELRLLSVNLNANCRWAGDRLCVTARWQCQAPLTIRGRIRIDLEFGYQRQMAEHQNEHTFTWDVYPELYLWDKGEIYKTAGTWKVPAVWGGTRRLFLSVLDENGAPVRFIGRAGREVLREYVGDVEFGFGAATPYQRSLTVPVETQIGPAAELAAGHRPKTPVASFRRIADNSQIQSTDEPSAFTVSPLDDGGEGVRIQSPYGACVVRETVCGGTRRWSLEDVQEAEGFELLRVYIPQAAIYGAGARIVNYFCGGRDIPVDENPPMGFRTPFDVINAAGIYDSKTGTLVETDRLDFVLHQSIQNIGGRQRAVIGVEMVHKVPTAAPGMLSVPVAGEKTFSVTQKAGADWQEFGRIIRSTLTKKDAPYCKKAILYKSMIDNGDGERYTLEDLRRFYRDVSMVTNGQPQIGYIVGWQDGGHDHGYPWPRKVNSRIGTPEALRACIQEAKAYNTVLSLHDNFEDVYPQYMDDEHKAMVAMDPYGQPYKGWIWSSGPSYILSIKRYWQSGIMARRIRQIVEDYGIETSYHIDVMSSENRRYDYAPDMLCGADESMAYKLQIFDEFARYGIDVTSETVARCFVGKTGIGWSTRCRDKDSLFLKEAEIPLTAMTYHGKLAYPGFGLDRQTLLKGLLYGEKAGWGDVMRLDQNRIRAHYILEMPMFLFEDMEIQAFRRDGGFAVCDYGNGSFVRVNLDTEEYQVVYGGRTVARNWTTCVPYQDEDSLYAYAELDGDYRFDLPGGWTGAKGRRLTVDGNGGMAECTVENQQLCIHLTGGIPVFIERVSI